MKSVAHVSVTLYSRVVVLLKYNFFWSLVCIFLFSLRTAPGNNDEDELYEMYMSETNAVYRFVDGELTLSDEYSGKPLKHAMLRSKEVCLPPRATSCWAFCAVYLDVILMGDPKPVTLFAIALLVRDETITVVMV